MKYLKLSPPLNNPPTSYLLLFNLSPPCQVAVESDPVKLIPDDSCFVAEDIDRLKINQRNQIWTTWKAHACSVYLMWSFFKKWIIKHDIFRARLLVNIVWNNHLLRIIAFPQIIGPFLDEKIIIITPAIIWGSTIHLIGRAIEYLNCFSE